jgi:hypothetical protein
MAVYIELVPQEGRNNNRNRGGGSSKRAGRSNVRRPLRGIEIKEDTYAYFRVLKSDGTPMQLVDSSSSKGSSPSYANFLLQSVQESRVERQQILETFGAPYVFFFGEAPRFVDVSAVLIDTHDFNWAAEWWENYERFLRGTKLAERGATALLHYDDVILEGYPLQANSSKSSGDRSMVQLQFRMFITNYLNVTNIGDPNFPIHDIAEIPELPARQTDTFFFDTSRTTDPKEDARVALLAYLQRLGVFQIQQQIARARTIERAREIQKQNALEYLGVDTDGANLLTIGKSIFQGVVAAVREDGESSKQAQERIKQEAKQALQFAMDGDPARAEELLSRGKIAAGLEALSTPKPSNISLNAALRRSLLYTASYPQANLSAFLQSVQSIVTDRVTPAQIMQDTRTKPYRSLISDNTDEYTNPNDDVAEEELEEFHTPLVGGDTPDLPGSIENSIGNAGGISSARALHGLGLMPPRSPLISIKLGNQQGPFGYAPMENGPFTFSKQWGTTPQVGGASGGNLGGAFGPGMGGKIMDLESALPGSGIAQGDLYGNSGLPPFFYTDGFGPKGTPIYEKKFEYGTKKDGSYLKGGVQVKSINDKDGSVQGKGMFSMVVVEGSLL